MLKNYFKVATRNLLKHKFYSLIAIFGLAVGITFTLLMGSYIWGELQVNSKLRNADSQYLVQSKWKEANMGPDFTTLAPMAKTLRDNYPHLVANYFRFDAITTAISTGDKSFREEVHIGDSTLLTMFGLELLHGHAQTALDNPSSMVISSETALKYFGRLDVMGEAMTIASFTGEKKAYTISGVLKKTSNNSVTNLLDPDIPVFLSVENMGFFNRGNLENWNNRYIVNYIELQEGVQKEDLIDPINQILASNAPENIKGNLETYLTPLKEYYRETNNGLVEKSIITFVVVSLFILLMSVVNFVNIFIGNSTSRLKEIGVRKVLGGRKVQVINQFLTESIIVVGLSMLLSLIFYEMLLSYFEDMVGKDMESLLFSSSYFIVVSIFLVISIGLLAGVYPAFILSKIQSIDAMKGKLKSVKENVLFRRSLIVSQFTIALFVIGSTYIIVKQVSYFFDKDLGYNKESILTVTVPRDWTAEGILKMESIRNEMENLPEINKASLSYEIPNGNAGFSNGVYKIGGDSTNAISVTILQTDEAYAETYQIPLIGGKFLPSGVDGNTDKIVINEAAALALGYEEPALAVGEQVNFLGFDQIFTINGVVENFHFGSMHKAINPLVFTHIKNANLYRYMSFQINPSNLASSLASIENKWKTLLPETPFEFNFMDDAIRQLYKTEIQLQKASNVATILSLIIVLLGVIGTVSMSVSKRTKELGIRKVLGASVGNIIFLFLSEFLWLLILAVIISFPIILYMMNMWLENYAYAIDVDWLALGLVGLVFGAIISLLVLLQSMRAAFTNPINALKNE